MNRPPIVWKPPATFDENKPGLGLPLLHGTRDTTVESRQDSTGQHAATG